MVKHHDPIEYIRGIQQILISDKKRIGFLSYFLFLKWIF